MGAADGDAYVEVDVGRIHYDFLVHLGTRSDDIAEAYTRSRSSDLMPGGRAWICGAGGPMGQMHAQRAAEKPDGPSLVVVTDIDGERLNVVLELFRPAGRGARRKDGCPQPQGDDAEAFDQALREVTGGQGSHRCRGDGAGSGSDQPLRHAPEREGPPQYLRRRSQRGTMARVPVLDAVRKDVRFIGTSGSRIEDLKSTLGATEEGTLSPNRSSSCHWRHRGSMTAWPRSRQRASRARSSSSRRSGTCRSRRFRN